MRWNDWLLIGAGFAFGSVIGATVIASILPNAIWIGSDGRVQWETMMTGLLAALAAFGTVHIMRQTISLNDRQEAERRGRRERAARATLPLALSSLCEYASQCMACTGAVSSAMSRGKTPPENSLYLADLLTPPAMPSDTLATLKECMEHSDDLTAAAISELICRLQVQKSRLNNNVARLRSSGQEKIVTQYSVDTGIIDSAEIYARCELLLPYARGESIPLAWPNTDNIYKALLIAGICPETHPQAYERAGKWRPGLGGAIKSHG